MFRLVGHNSFVQSSSDSDDSLVINEGAERLELALRQAIM